MLLWKVLRRFQDSVFLSNTDDVQRNWSSHQDKAVMGIQGRLAAASLVVRSADSARRLFFGRFLVLTEIMIPDAADTALLMYLQATNVLGIGARTVPLPVISTTTLDASLQQLHLDDQSSAGLSLPRKRSRVTSLLETHGMRDKNTALDALLIELSQNLGPAIGDATTGSLCVR